MTSPSWREREGLSGLYYSSVASSASPSLLCRDAYSSHGDSGPRSQQPGQGGGSREPPTEAAPTHLTAKKEDTGRRGGDAGSSGLPRAPPGSPGPDPRRLQPVPRCPSVPPPPPPLTWQPQAAPALAQAQVQAGTRAQPSGGGGGGFRRLPRTLPPPPPPPLPPPPDRRPRPRCLLPGPRCFRVPRPLTSGIPPPSLPRLAEAHVRGFPGPRPLPVPRRRKGLSSRRAFGGAGWRGGEPREGVGRGGEQTGQGGQGPRAAQLGASPGTGLEEVCRMPRSCSR
ncbi:basic proline-rich protein-like [Trichosurus vulpecula]|uniref:basic proline-rich protein-like n=1 Tax=Trichosurus vulpecula TaxID=9337 RepID=UPI00186AF99C|nr:basic proline-rich protein-like [Trichosurus vulpecula]